MRKWRIDGDETSLHVRIILPLSHEQIRLDGLTTYVAQTGRNKGHTKAGMSDSFQRQLTPRAPALAPTGENIGIKFAVLLMDSLNPEVLQYELPRSV